MAQNHQCPAASIAQSFLFPPSRPANRKVIANAHHHFTQGIIERSEYIKRKDYMQKSSKTALPAEN
jgi:hypothetical protein